MVVAAAAAAAAVVLEAVLEDKEHDDRTDTIANVCNSSAEKSHTCKTASISEKMEVEHKNTARYRSSMSQETLHILYLLVLRWE